MSLLLYAPQEWGGRPNENEERRRGYEEDEKREKRKA
jgi:hypothetical protein